MNRDPVEIFFRKADGVKLDKKKKDIIRQEVLFFMGKSPYQEEGVKKRWFGFYLPHSNNFRLKAPVAVFAVMFLFFLVGGATTVKADSALPGDFLYPIKLGFNEKIKEMLAFSDESKLNAHIEFAKVRLQEFEKLSAQGRINSNNETQINNNFKNQSDKVSEYISKLSTTKDTEKAEAAITDFEASLRAQGIIINGLQKKTGNTVANSIANSVEDTASLMSNFNANLNNRKDTNIKPSDRDKNIQEKISAIQNSVEKVRKLIQKNGANIGNEAILQSEDNLNLVQQKIDEGKNKLSKNQDDYKGLNSSLQEASVIAQESKYLIDSKSNLGVKIPINISSQDTKDTTGNENSKNLQDNNGDKNK